MQQMSVTLAWRNYIYRTAFTINFITPAPNSVWSMNQRRSFNSTSFGQISYHETTLVSLHIYVYKLSSTQGQGHNTDIWIILSIITQHRILLLNVHRDVLLFPGLKFYWGASLELNIAPFKALQILHTCHILTSPNDSAIAMVSCMLWGILFVSNRLTGDSREFI